MEALGIETVYYTTQSYGQGTIINIDNCVNEINNLIAAHYYKPSFDNVTLTGALNTGFILIDSNNEIGNFPFLNLNGNELTIADNQVAVRLLNQDSNNVTLSKLNKITTNIYKSDLSQTLARLGTTNIQVDSIINLNVIKGVINLNSIENNQFKGDSTLENAVYEISNGDLFKVQLRTDQAGNLTMPSLANGDYLIKQLTPSLGYLPNPAEYQASITRDNPTCNIELNNQLIQSEVVINAYLNDETLNTCQQAALISFGIYHNDTLIYTIETNETGLASILLPYGEYTIKQLTNLTDYEMSEEFNVSINNAMEDYQEYNIAINKIIPPLNETDSKVKPTIIQTTNPIIPKATIELNKDKIKANPIVEPSKSIKKSVIITKKEPKHVKKSDVKDKSKLNLKKSDLSISFIIIIIGIIIVYINRKYRNSY